jgi:hypothetical protein
MEFLIGLLFVVVLVTLVGHGLWVMFAALFRALGAGGNDRPQARSRPATRCADCGTRLLEWDRLCPSCGLDPDSSRARQLREVDVAAWQVRDLFERKELDEETMDRVIGLFRERRKVLQGRGAPRPAPAAAPPAEVEVVQVPALRAPAQPSEKVLDALPVAEALTPPEPPPPSRPAEVLSVSLPLPVSAAATAPPVVGALPPPPPPRRVTNVLSAFMEEKNILWGELVGGLLIVGCSIALVLTLWNSLQALPYFPFLLFTTLTTSLFAAGQYTLHHWKLRSTSRGLLLIALLLAPLNLLVLADPTARGGAVNVPWLDLGVGIAALLGFTFLVRAAGRDLIGTDVLPGPLDRRWLLALAVVGAAGSQLLTPHLLDSPRTGLPERLMLLCYLPCAFHLLACAAVLAGLTLYPRREEHLRGVQAGALFTFLGLATFSLLSAFGFLLTRLASPAAARHLFACPLILAGAPAVAAGLVVLRRLQGEEGLRAAGTGVCLAGLALMLAGVALAWPSPTPLLAALLLAGGVLAVAAFAGRVPWAHAGAVPCLALAVLVAFHLAAGRLPVAEDPAGTLLRLLVSADSGAVLAGLAALFMGLALALPAALSDHALAFKSAALALGGAALIVVTGHGPDRPLTAAGVHLACFAVGALASVATSPTRQIGEGEKSSLVSASGLWDGALAHLACALLIPGTLWALYGLYPQRHELWAVVLAGETLVFAVAAVGRGGRLAPLSAAAGRLALFAGALALLLAVFSPAFPHGPIHTATTLLLSAAVLVQSLRERSAGWFAAFQVALAGSVLCAVTAVARPRGWLLDERALPAYGVGLALLSLAWVAARRLMALRPSLDALLPASWPGVDRLTTAGVLVGQLFLAGFAALPGIAAEWSPDVKIVSLPLLVGGSGQWLLLGVLAAVLLAMLIRPARSEEEGIRKSALLGGVLLSFTTALLWADLHAADRATASALRWGLATCFLGGSVLVWLRREVGRIAEGARLAIVPAAGEVRVLLGAAAFAVVLLTVILAELGFSGAPVPGPLARSVFARMGAVLSSIGPLALVVVGLAGTALRERSPGYALAAGLLSTVSVMGGHALGVVTSGRTFDDSQAVLAVLLGAVAAGVGGLLWLAARRRIGGGPLLAMQAWGGLFLTVAVAVLFLPALLRGPGLPPEKWAEVLGGPAGWFALLIGAGAAAWHASAVCPRRRVHFAGVVLLAAGILGAAFARPHDTALLWVSYHALAGSWAAVAVMLAVGGSLVPLRTRRWQVLVPARRLRPWLIGLAVALTVLAVRGSGVPSARPTPLVAALAASVLAGAAALWFRQGMLAHLSGSLFALGTFLAWVAWGRDVWTDGCLSTVIGLALASAFWQAITLPGLRLDVAPLRWPGGRFSPLAAWLALLLLAFLVVLAVGCDAVGEPNALRITELGWFAALAVGFAFAVLTADAKEPGGAAPGLYLLGLLVVGLGLHALALPPGRLAWAGALALAVQVTAAALIGRLLLPGRLEPDPETPLQLSVTDRHWRWLLPAQAVVAFAVVLLSFGVAVNHLPLAERLMGPLALALMAPAAVVLADSLSAAWRDRLFQTAAACAALALAALAWAAPDPAGPTPWLHRNAWLLAAMTAAAALCLEALARWPAVAAPLRRLGVVLGWVAVLLAPVVLGQMVPVFDKVARRTPLSGPAIVAVGLALLGLTALALRLALKAERDPLGLSERGRTLYVYLAEVLVVLLFLHLRLNVPELFHGLLARYWTLIVLLIAFLGVGLSELCERHGLRVLAGPLQRTGIFLPLIPILAFWVTPPGGLLALADQTAPGTRPILRYFETAPRNFDAYALIWLLTAALYGVVATARRSTGWAIAAALAANFGLWALLMHAGVGFLVHPQAWVIPLGVILLVAEHVHRERLPAEGAQALRYLGISLIYVASTADLFLTGLGNSLWLPIVLAALCVAGVLLGILLRVRAFLYLGVGFLLVDVFSMIWHAAVDRSHTWLWWASGIVLGAAILALFALFEKRRNDVMAMLDRFRQWE